VLSVVGLLVAGVGTAHAQPNPSSPSSPATSTERRSSAARRLVIVEPRTPRLSEPDKAGSVVTRKDLDERLPRSAPDALRFEPGVYVQQTAHAQGSAYIRGLTGQQTLLMFDGIRINTSTFRQGPNQYFFLLDAKTVQRIDVIRGSASTRYGTDALGGVIMATPIEPSLEVGRWPLVVHARGMSRTGTADGELGGRAQVDVSWRGKLGLFGGIGYRDVGLLRSGGKFRVPATGEYQTIPPRFAEDGKTQLGTGFNELTADARLVWQPSSKHRLTAAYYDYRQFDAPRTDKCPSSGLQLDTCLTYLEQFRTMTYLAYKYDGGPAAATAIRATLSYQRLHERRHLDQGALSSTEQFWRDDVHTFGGALHVRTQQFSPTPWWTFAFDYGADGYRDRVDSTSWLYFSDTAITRYRDRGQYMDEGRFSSSGAWGNLDTTFAEIFRLRAGGRTSFVTTDASGQASSDSKPVHRHFATTIGNIGASVRAVPWLVLSFGLDQAFRAPNLDDLTSRQLIGSGAQTENTALAPERSTTIEGGLRIEHPWVEFSAWVFRTTIDGLIQRRAFDPSDCPRGDLGCAGARARFGLQNADGDARLWGVDGGVRVYLPWDLGARATIAWAKGDMPHTLLPGQREPMSRVPPLNGTAEFGWRPSRWGFHVIFAVRWATQQSRLAEVDKSDVRIPRGGTPGFAVLDVRAGYRFDPHWVLGLSFENLTDAAYRYHGSAINGPGRSLLAQVEFGF